MRRSIVLLIAVAFLGIGCLTWLASAQLTAAGRTENPPADNAPPPESKVDLNRATLEDLCSLPGINRETGQRLIKHRPYRRLDDLVVRKILSRKQFARIREYVSVGVGQ
jgi:DNA uptake protein ComE-like DNA-binding protein